MPASSRLYAMGSVRYAPAFALACRFQYFDERTVPAIGASRQVAIRCIRVSAVSQTTGNLTLHGYYTPVTGTFDPSAQ